MKQQLLVLFMVIGLVQLRAQSGGHVTCVPYCELFSTIKVKNSVSCIDGICTPCLKKKEEARKKYQEQEKLDAEKRVRDEQQRKQDYTAAVEQQKKALAVMRQKQKENEVVLVAPKPKVDNTPVPKPVVTLSAKDREILELSRTKKVFAKYLSGKEYYNGQWVEFPTPEIKVGYEENGQMVVLKQLVLKTKTPYKRLGFGSLENGYFITYFMTDRGDEEVRDLVGIDGTALFNDTQIKSILSYSNGLYLIGRKTAADAGIDQCSVFNINSRRSYPFPEGLVSDNIASLGGKSTYSVQGPYDKLICAVTEKQRYVRTGRSLKIMATWNLEEMRQKGYAFYNDYTLSSGPHKGESLKDAEHGSPPAAYLQHRDKCILMYLFFHNIVNETNKYGGEDHIVKSLSVYGFDAVNGQFILFDQIDYKRSLDYYHILTGYWFGQMK